jgi:hypothetical protein
MLPGRASGSPTAGRAAPFQLLIARNEPANKGRCNVNTHFQACKDVVFL